LVSATYTGGDKMIADMGAVAVDLRKSILQKALKSGAQPIQARIAELAPASADAPHIKDHIGISAQSKVGGQSLREGEAAVKIGPTKGFAYGVPQEFGWKFHPAPHPFVRRGFEETKEQALRRVGEELWAGIAARLGR
jgi:HK97 gp10 family phage protein